MRWGPLPPPKSRALSVHHQYSSRVSPFQAKTGIPASAMAAAAWSWVEKMLQLAQRTSAPRATSVSISTAVCTVMCRLPVTRAPFRGCAPRYRSLMAISPGISFSAISISFRPNLARDISATLYSFISCCIKLFKNEGQKYSKFLNSHAAQGEEPVCPCNLPFPVGS